jgi:hypothetical protein
MALIERQPGGVIGNFSGCRVAIKLPLSATALSRCGTSVSGKLVAELPISQRIIKIGILGIQERLTSAYTLTREGLIEFIGNGNRVLLARLMQVCRKGNEVWND